MGAEDPNGILVTWVIVILFILAIFALALFGPNVGGGDDE